MTNIKFIIKFFKIFFFIIFIFTNNLYGEEIKKISIAGNQRILEETIKSFLTIKINDNATIESINDLTKNLYDTNFFENVSVKIENNVLIIDVKENPIIQNIIYDRIKSETLKEKAIQNTKLIERSAYINLYAKNDSELILDNLKNNGYYFSSISIKTEKLENNTVNLIYQIDLGEKAKIRKISFIGNKIFKDNRLKNIILSEEYKFWKFLSGRKYLNEDLISTDQRLLKNYYLNKGYYNVKINSSFAKLNNNDQFELTYNIDSGQKIYFDNLSLKIPDDFSQNNFIKINKLFKDLKGKAYSLNEIESILDEIEEIAVNEEFSSIKASVNENISSDKIDLEFALLELDPSYLTRINIYGNNITEETVIRNQIIVDEGDPYNEILLSKSINNIKSLNIFKSVRDENVVDDLGNKSLDITVEEKPTGEIMAGAGYGTNGGTLAFSVKENNFLGKGVSLESSINLTETSIKGGFEYL